MKALLLTLTMVSCAIVGTATASTSLKSTAATSQVVDTPFIGKELAMRRGPGDKVKCRNCTVIIINGK